MTFEEEFMPIKPALIMVIAPIATDYGPIRKILELENSVHIDAHGSSNYMTRNKSTFEQGWANAQIGLVDRNDNKNVLVSATLTREQTTDLLMSGEPGPDWRNPIIQALDIHHWVWTLMDVIIVLIGGQYYVLKSNCGDPELLRMHLLERHRAIINGTEQESEQITVQQQRKAAIRANMITMIFALIGGAFLGWSIGDGQKDNEIKQLKAQVQTYQQNSR